jgi:hypothetical protein
MRLTEEDIEHVLNQKGVDQPRVVSIMLEIKRLENQEAELAAAKKADRKKKKFVLVASDPDDRYAEVVECPVWVVQMNDEDNHTDVVEKISRATYEYNNDVLNGNKKSSTKNPVYKISESLERVQAKYFADEDITIKTKEPTIIVRTDNEIPQS